ncbi:MAG: alpha/beta hydrolase [Caulobacter sp. 32-67-35]|nr:MAG: alpha/beta hydrolase [Caulobacter sp. 32-67-35]
MNNNALDGPHASRRGVLATGLSLAAISVAPSLIPALPASAQAAPSQATKGSSTMSSGFVSAQDGVQIFYKDWGPKSAQPIVFHHGWPLSSDDWDAQMMFFLLKGYRVIAHDRRGHGRSTQTDTGNEMDTYAADVIALANHLDLKNAFHVGHSTGGGEAIHYAARAKPGRVSKVVLVGAVPPIMLKTPANPGGLPMEVFDGFRADLVANRAQFFRDIPEGPFFGFNRPGAKVSQGLIDNWWRQGMEGGAKAHYDCIKAFSETDFTDDLKKVDIPVLIMHGEDDQLVPIANSAHLAIKLVKKGTLKTYPGLPHGMASTHPEIINADLLAFFKA